MPHSKIAVLGGTLAGHRVGFPGQGVRSLFFRCI